MFQNEGWKYFDIFTSIDKAEQCFLALDKMATQRGSDISKSEHNLTKQSVEENGWFAIKTNVQ